MPMMNDGSTMNKAAYIVIDAHSGKAGINNWPATRAAHRATT
jgi:hypothetical protein